MTNVEILDPPPLWRTLSLPLLAPVLVCLWIMARGLTDGHLLLVFVPPVVLAVVTTAVIGEVLAVWHLAARRRRRLLVNCDPSVLCVLTAQQLRIAEEPGTSRMPKFGLLLVGVERVAFVRSRTPSDIPVFATPWNAIRSVRLQPVTPDKADFVIEPNSGPVRSWRITGYKDLVAALRAIQSNGFV